MKVIFSDEYRTNIYSGTIAVTFVWWRSNETCKYGSLKEATKFFESFMILDCISYKEQREIAIISSIINTHVYIEIVDNFLVHRKKGIKVFL